MDIIMLNSWRLNPTDIFTMHFLNDQLILNSVLSIQVIFCSSIAIKEIDLFGCIIGTGGSCKLNVIMASTCFFYKAPQPKPAPYWKCIMFGDCFPKSPIDKVVFRARSLFESCRKLWSSSFWSAHSWTQSKATVHNESRNLLQFSIWCLKAWGLFIIWLGTAHCWHSVHSAGTPPFCQGWRGGL